MTTEHYSHFIPHKRGWLRDQIDEWRRQNEEARKAQRDFADEFGAEGTCSTSYSITGLMWRDVTRAPTGWKRSTKTTDNGEPFFTPDRKTKIGRDAAKRMAALPIARGGLLTKMITGDSMVFTGRTHSAGKGMALGSCSLEIFGGVDVVGIPNVYEGETSRPAVTPKGARQIPLSKYFAMKEDQQLADLLKKQSKRKAKPKAKK